MVTNETTTPVAGIGHNRKNKKALEIRERTFKFTKYKLAFQLKYRGNGKAADKRFDSATEGLCLFIYPSEKKTFYAVKSKEMYNRKKGRTETNAQYKKIFRFDPAAKGYGYDDAKDKVREVLELMDKAPVTSWGRKTFGDLAKLFYDEGMKSHRLDNEDLNYKESTTTRYKAIINQHILLRPSGYVKLRGGRLKLNMKLSKKMSERITYKGRVCHKPLKDYFVDEIEAWHIEAVKHRLRDTKAMANQTMHMICTVFKWAKVNNYFKGANPCEGIKFFTDRKIKCKLHDSDLEKLLNYIKGKAFDYQPHFCTLIGLHVFTGQRSSDLFGLRWTPPISATEKEACTGWLLDNWDKVDKPHFHIFDMKNREPVNIFIDRESRAMLLRLKESLYNERNSWALQSPFIFPRKKDPSNYVMFRSFCRLMPKLNKIMGFKTVEGDIQKTPSGYKPNVFTWKVARKSAGTWFARNYGIDIASRKLNHKSTQVTRDHYIVPDPKDLEIENVYQNRIDKKDIVKGVIVNNKKAK